MAIAFDRKGRSARKWNTIRNKFMQTSGQSKGLTGAALEAAIMALAVDDPSLVKIETRA